MAIDFCTEPFPFTAVTVYDVTGEVKEGVPEMAPVATSN